MTFSQVDGKKPSQNMFCTLYLHHLQKKDNNIKRNQLDDLSLKIEYKVYLKMRRSLSQINQCWGLTVYCQFFLKRKTNVDKEKQLVSIDDECDYDNTPRHKTTRTELKCMDTTFVTKYIKNEIFGNYLTTVIRTES